MAGIYTKTGLIGGGAWDLDSIDGNLLDGSSCAIVIDQYNVYVYRVNTTIGGSENSPSLITPDTNPGTKRWVLLSAGRMFSSTITSGVQNVTGDGTVYNLTGGIWTERGDYGNVFLNGVFTAPSDDWYSFAGYVMISGLTSSHNKFNGSLYTSNKVYDIHTINPGTIHFSGHLGFGISVKADMEKNDTAYLRIEVAGSTKVVDVTQYTHFQCSRI